MRLLSLAAVIIVLPAVAVAQPACTGGGCTADLIANLTRMNEIMSASLIRQTIAYDSESRTISRTRSDAGTTRFVGGALDIVHDEWSVGVQCREDAECLDFAPLSGIESRVPFMRLYGIAIGQEASEIDELVLLLSGLVARSARMAEYNDAMMEGMLEGTFSGLGASPTTETLTLADGSVYTGETLVGRPDGQGSVIYTNGNHYDGSWVEGLKHGWGTYTFPDGDVYIGEMVQDRIEGTGRIVYSDGAVYEGQFANGTRDGTGALVRPDGSRYEGDWRGGASHGPGRATIADGSFSEGTFVDGRLQGLGLYTDANGTTFDGTFVDGLPAEGVLISPGRAPRRVRWNGERFVSTDAPASPAAGCGALVVDLDRGAMNGIAPTATRDAIKAQFPCATGETPEGGPFNYGGGVYFLRHGFFFYTHRDFLEVRSRFTGTTEPALLGRTLASAGLSAPSRIDGNSHLFAKEYGCLRVETDSEGVITELGVHATQCVALVIPR